MIKWEIINEPYDSVLIHLSYRLGYATSSIVFSKDTLLNKTRSNLVKAKNEHLETEEYFLLMEIGMQTYIVARVYYLKIRQVEDNPINDSETRRIVLSAIV